MNKPVYWWCLKDKWGKLWPITAHETYAGVEEVTDRSHGEIIVKLRIEEVPEKGKGGRR